MTTEIASGVIAPLKSQGPLPGVAAVATGCLPVSRAEVLDVVDRILRMADFVS